MYVIGVVLVSFIVNFGLILHLVYASISIINFEHIIAGQTAFIDTLVDTLFELPLSGKVSVEYVFRY